MKNLEIQKGRILEIIIDHDDHSKIVIEDEAKNTKTYTLTDRSLIMNDEDFEHLNIDQLSVMLPVYAYAEESNTDLKLLVISQNEDLLFQKLSVFDDQLVSDDQSVQINETSINMIESIDGSFNIIEVLKNKQLLVFYHRSTKSIPSRVDPVKIIIM